MHIDFIKLNMKQLIICTLKTNKSNTFYSLWQNFCSKMIASHRTKTHEENL